MRDRRGGGLLFGMQQCCIPRHATGRPRLAQFVLFHDNPPRCAALCGRARLLIECEVDGG